MNSVTIKIVATNERPRKVGGTWVVPEAPQVGDRITYYERDAISYAVVGRRFVFDNRGVRHIEIQVKTERDLRGDRGAAQRNDYRKESSLSMPAPVPRSP